VSFKLRNTVVLASLAFLISAAGMIYWKWYQPRKLKEIAKEMQLTDKKINDMAGLLQKVEQLDAQYKDIKRKYDSRSKEIPTSDVSSQTYGYMSRGQDESMTDGDFPKFNMTFEGTHRIGNYGYNSYKLSSGTGQFASIYKFIYYLENGRRLYKIRSISLEQKEKVDPDTKETKSFLELSMELDAYFTSIDVLATSLAAKSLTAVPAPFDPFKPLVVSTIATEAPPNQINADMIDIKAVLPGKAFALNGDELILLHVGDKVWRGSVTKIDPATSTVQFLLNEGGLFKRLDKKILFEKRKGR
jgi:hypothetical protein